jgi:hypothetical protein
VPGTGDENTAALSGADASRRLAQAVTALALLAGGGLFLLGVWAQATRL